MKNLILFLFLFVHSLYSQNWTLKEIGAGIFTNDSEYDKVLKIVEKGTLFNQKKLYDSGAFSNRGNSFGVWIVGPHTDEYLNKAGVPVWGYKFNITYPNGTQQEFGKYGFYKPGFATSFINASQPSHIGKWKIDFYICNMENNETRFVGSTEFFITDDQKQNTNIPGWQLKEIGIGIYNDAKYDSELIIVKQGDTWSQSELYNNGNFSGRGNVFGTWIVGPHTSTYMNKGGVPVYSYNYKITYPDGSIYESGNYGFYTPGFATAALMFYDSKSVGTIQIDYGLINNETKEIFRIGTKKIEMKK